MASKELLDAWLKDAHGMEKALIEFCEKIQKHFDGNSEYSSVFNSIIDKSNEHQADVQILLDDDESDISKGKDFIAKVSSFVGGAGSSVFGDDKVKDVLALHGALHFAHACYLSLAHGASTLGNEEIAAISARISSEKVELADAVLSVVDGITDDALAERQ